MILNRIIVNFVVSLATASKHLMAVASRRGLIGRSLSGLAAEYLASSNLRSALGTHDLEEERR